MNYYIALTTTSDAGFQSGLYNYLDHETTEVDSITILNGLNHEVPIEEALTDTTATFITWSAEFVWYALKKMGYPTDIKQWISLDIWRVASGFPRSIDRTKEANALIRNSTHKYITPETLKARKELTIKEAQIVRATFVVMNDRHKATEPNWSEWQAHVRINARGVLIDRTFVHCYSVILTLLEDIYRGYCCATFGTPEPKALEILAYVNRFGAILMKSLTREEVARLLAIRVNVPENSTATAKAYEKARRFIDVQNALMWRDLTTDRTYVKLETAVLENERLRGAYHYNGTQTGRWTSLNINLHNLAKDGNLEECRDGRAKVLARDTDVLDVDSKGKGRLWLLRTAFIAPKGSKLVMMDFRQIEARILAWFAGEEWKVEAFREGRDIYKETASKLFSTPIDRVTNEQRKYGKLAELGLGYGGSAKVLIDRGVNSSVATRIVAGWRNINEGIVAMWERLHKAYTYTYTQRRDSSVNGVLLSVHQNGIAIKLLTGRTIVCTEEPSKVTGATLTARVISAMARDVLATALVRLSGAGVRVVMHQHDEVVAEVEEAKLEEVIAKMQEVMVASSEVVQGLTTPLEVSVKVNDFYY